MRSELRAASISSQSAGEIPSTCFPPSSVVMKRARRWPADPERFIILAPVRPAISKPSKIRNAAALSKAVGTVAHLGAPF
jgi:hypothetical protein